MRWSSYLSPSARTALLGLVRGDELRGVAGLASVADLVGDDFHDRMRRAEEEALGQPFEILRLADVQLLAPLPRPPSVRDFMAFEQHVARTSAAVGQKMHPDWYEIPVFYFQNPAAIRGPSDPVAIAPGSSAFDFELEVAAVVGSECRDVQPDEAERHIAGFVVMCDWSARDLQEREMKQGLGPAKGKDTATSLGPYLVTADELVGYRTGQSYSLRMTAMVNDTVVSVGNLADIYWSFGQMISYASRGTVVRPGDIIGSGTVGTGCLAELRLTRADQPPAWLRPGDRVRLEVDVLGAIDTVLEPPVAVFPLR